LLLFSKRSASSLRIGQRQGSLPQAKRSGFGINALAVPAETAKFDSTLMRIQGSSIATKRLCLRPFGVADAPDLFSIRGDAQAMEFWDWPADQTLEETRELARLLELEVEAGVAHYWTARVQSGEFVGLFDLSSLHAKSADLGFMVARRHWRQGYASEAAGALIGEAQRRGLAHLNARIHAANVASRQLLHKLGFYAAGPDEFFEVAPRRSILCAFFRLAVPVADDDQSG
jgi:RimJ/RimL family protein N-acetyltransferase